MSSEEIASADSLLTENAALRARILEWEDAYDRLAGAFDLHMAILECNGALADLAGGFYDVCLGELAAQAERAETARKAWTEIGAQAQATLQRVEQRAERFKADVGEWWWLVNDLEQLGCLDASNAACDRARAALTQSHPGASLLAELTLARAVVQAATMLGSGPDSVTWTRMYAAIEAYEQLVKARGE